MHTLRLKLEMDKKHSIYHGKAFSYPGTYQ